MRMRNLMFEKCAMENIWIHAGKSILMLEKITYF